MASDGLTNRAKRGKCRMCQRSRCTTKYVREVGEVHHGYATGHIWECMDTQECDAEIQKKLNSQITNYLRGTLEFAVREGRLKEYTHYN
jgi:hypothetical protein